VGDGEGVVSDGEEGRGATLMGAVEVGRAEVVELGRERQRLFRERLRWSGGEGARMSMGWATARWAWLCTLRETWGEARTVAERARARTATRETSGAMAGGERTKD
jgi:hypothetical protein